MKLQDFKNIHASGKDLNKIISVEQVIWSSKPSRMMWRVDNRPEGRVLVIYPESGGVAIAHGLNGAMEVGDVGIYNSATGKTEKLPTDVARVETVGKLILQGDMRFMFADSQATSLDLSSFDTSKVTDMRYMFRNSQATSLDLSSFDTSSVTNMTSMFRNSQATSLDLSSFDTSSVTDMMSMFDSSQATSLDLSSFDTSKVTDMRYMFSDSQAKSVYVRNSAEKIRFEDTKFLPSGIRFIVK